MKRLIAPGADGHADLHAGDVQICIVAVQFVDLSSAHNPRARGGDMTWTSSRGPRLGRYRAT